MNTKKSTLPQRALTRLRTLVRFKKPSTPSTYTAATQIGDLLGLSHRAVNSLAARATSDDTLFEQLETLCREHRQQSNLLDTSALHYGTDKSSRYHNYVRHYEMLLRPSRLTAKKILEIGVQSGASLKMWSDYFPHAQIFGIDNDPKSFQSPAGRIKTFLGDQARPEFLAEVLKVTGNDIDVIIDDGGHAMDQQRASLVALFSQLRPGGYYIVEDTHTSYYDYLGGGLHNPASTVEVIKHLIDELHFFGKADLGDPLRVMELNPEHPFSQFQKLLESIWIAKSMIVLRRHERTGSTTRQNSSGEQKNQ